MAEDSIAVVDTHSRVRRSRGAALPRFMLAMGMVVGVSPTTASSLAAASTGLLPAREVVIRGEDTFDPPVVIIEEGESVLWRNASVFVHSVTAHPDFATTRESFDLPSGAAPFHSGLLIPGDEFVHVFETPGTYRYFCVPHEATRHGGWVEVRPRAQGP